MNIPENVSFYSVKPYAKDKFFKDLGKHDLCFTCAVKFALAGKEVEVHLSEYGTTYGCEAPGHMDIDEDD